MYVGGTGSHPSGSHLASPLIGTAVTGTATWKVNPPSAIPTTRRSRKNRLQPRIEIPQAPVQKASGSGRGTTSCRSDG